MKTLKGIAIASILIIIVAMMAMNIYLVTHKTKLPTFTQSDSIELVHIDSVKGEYQQIIDSLNKRKPQIITRIKWLHDTDTVYYNGNDTACIEIIDRKNKLIVGQDSLIEILDLEARTYSDLCLIEQNKSKLLFKRNTELSYQLDNTIVLYKDSLKLERKTAKKKLFWNNVKWSVASAVGIYGMIQLGR